MLRSLLLVSGVLVSKIQIIVFTKSLTHDRSSPAAQLGSRSLRLMALRHPDKIFTTVLPPPPPWPAPNSLSLSPTWRTSSSLQWKEAGVDDKTLTRVLSYLQRTLRSVHKRKISWPVEESSSSKYVCLTITIWIDNMHYSNLTPSEYFMTLL